MKRNYSFHLHTEKDAFLIRKLDALNNKSDVFKMLLKDHFDQDHKHQTKIDEEIKKEKLTLLKIERAHKVKKIEESHARKRLIDTQRVYLERFEVPIKQKTLGILKKDIDRSEPEIEVNIVDKKHNYLNCTHCGQAFNYNPDSRFDISEAKEVLINHYFDKHKIGLSNIEAELLKAL